MSATEGPTAATELERAQPFRALLAAALKRDDAAYGLACAYSELAREERMRLLELLITDARAEQLELGAVLARVCAVENDPELLMRIVAHLREAGVPITGTHAKPARAPACGVLLAGDAASGAAVIARPPEEHAAADDAAQTEVLGLCWDAAGITRAVRARMSRTELPQLARRLQPMGSFESSPLDYAAEIIARAAWQHRRNHGSLPEALTDFADLIGPTAK